MGKWGYGPGPKTRDAEGRRRVPEIVPTPDEEWRSVVGWEGLYSVSSCGRTRSDRAREGGRLLSQSFKGQDGYLGVRLVRPDGSCYTPLVATLVAAAFIGPRGKMTIDHKDGNKLNNRADNLEYVTQRVNHGRSVDMGLHPWGERHGLHKLTKENVREIRTRRLTRAEYAAKFHVSLGCIQGVRSGHTWKHLV